MNRAVAIAVVLVGLVLMFMGISAMNSLGSDLSRFFTGAPTDKSVWMFLGGVAATATGLVLASRSSKSS